MDVSFSKLWEMVKDREVLESMGLQRVGHNLATEQHIGTRCLSRFMTHSKVRFWR